MTADKISYGKNAGENAHAARLPVLLLSLLVLTLTIESGTRIGFIRSSRIQSRIHREYVAAREIRPVAGDGRPTVLLIGNSLVLAGVSMPTLENLVSDRIHPARYAVENTQFLDWYFGLRRLFEEGSRPSRVLLGLTSNRLASRAVLGEYFGRYMMNGRDIVDVASAAGLSLTDASNLLFANWSAWLGSKSEVRKWFAGHLIPDTNQVAGLLARRDRADAPLAESAGLIEQRLSELKELCHTHGAEIAIVVMPDRGISNANMGVLQNSGAHTGVSILVPMGMQELPPSCYQNDGFHLNEQGAERFTGRLAITLREWVGSDAGLPK